MTTHVSGGQNLELNTTGLQERENLSTEKLFPPQFCLLPNLGSQVHATVESVETMDGFTSH